MDKPAQKIAFGVFEADASSGELRKNGMKVKIQEQPFQVLMMLLERPGEVVPREDLRLRLWPADTFVDFDHGLNTAINKLREALGDVASNPRFVETLARRGYRFIAPVRSVEASSAQAPAATPSTTHEKTAPPSGAEGEQNGPASAITAATAPDTVQAVADSAPTATMFPDSAAGEEDEEELPAPSRPISRLLFGLVQFMYLVFYGVALVRLEHIPEIAAPFMGSLTVALIPLVIVTATVGIALRLYLLTAVSFDYRPLGAKFRKLFPVILPLDMLWALSPFLLLGFIGIGGAFAACAALLYLPFSERTLIRMAYRYDPVRRS